jgi:hypothetical protein
METLPTKPITKPITWAELKKLENQTGTDATLAAEIKRLTGAENVRLTRTEMIQCLKVWFIGSVPMHNLKLENGHWEIIPDRLQSNRMHRQCCHKKTGVTTIEVSKKFRQLNDWADTQTINPAVIDELKTAKKRRKCLSA